MFFSGYQLYWFYIGNLDEIVAFKEEEGSNQVFIEQDQRGRSSLTLMVDTEDGNLNFKDCFF